MVQMTRSIAQLHDVIFHYWATQNTNFSSRKVESRNLVEEQFPHARTFPVIIGRRNCKTWEVGICKKYAKNADFPNFQFIKMHSIPKKMKFSQRLGYAKGAMPGMSTLSLHCSLGSGGGVLVAKSPDLLPSVNASSNCGRRGVWRGPDRLRHRNTKIAFRSSLSKTQSLTLFMHVCHICMNIHATE